MKTLFLLIPLLVLCCTTSTITINREALVSVKTIAITPFTASIAIDSNITAEAGEMFRQILTDMNYHVIERARIDALLQREEFSKTGITENNVISAGRILDADAVLFGEITIHDEKQKIIRHSGSFGMLLFDKDYDKTETRIYYRFRITLKLVNAKDGSTIFTITNRYIEAEHDEYMPGYVSLNAYRRLTLKKMGNELMETIRGKY